MSRQIDDIKDDEIRAIRSSKSNAANGTLSGGGSSKRKTWLFVLAIALVILIIGGVILKFSQSPKQDAVSELFEPENVSSVIELKDPIKFLGNYETEDIAYTEIIQRTINDIPLRIYIPHNAKASLLIGVPDCNDANIIFATQAADIRADNRKINGAFVIKGKPVAWGLSKKGYVGIIGDSIYIGKADNSPLFEKATENEGHFFRQYALVDNGTIVENEPKNKSYRKAICDRGGEIMVVMSQTRESFHDFAQALVDLRVDNAVYLVGSKSYGFYRDRENFLSLIERKESSFRNENYIVWSAK